MAATAGVAALLLRCGSTSSRTTPSGGSATKGGPQTGGTFTYYWNANPPSLDPQFFATGATTSFACACMSGILRFKIATDPQVGLNHELENDLAVSIESPDATTWTIKLRNDAQFHLIASVAGHAVQAEDVKATFTRAVTSTENPNRGTIGVVDPDQIETPDASTVVFKLKYPYAPFANLLGTVQYGLIYPREVLTGDYDPSRQVIGSGPFVFDGYSPDLAVAMKKNTAYYEKGLPYMDNVRHAIIPNTAQQLAQFKGGNLDVLHVAQNDLSTATKSSPKARLFKVLTGGGVLVDFQMGDKASPFQDIRLRQAVSLAIDRSAIGKSIYANQFEPAFAVNLSMGNWALHMDQLDKPTQQFYKFDLSQAKKLVQAAGGSSLNLKVAYPAHAFGTEFDTVVQTIYNMLSALPWKLTLVSIDYNKDWLGNGKGYSNGYFPTDTIVCGTSNPFAETDQYLYGYYHSQSDRNKQHLQDPALDALIDKARGIVDAEQRRQAYLDAQKYLAQKLYGVAGLPGGYTYTLLQPNVQNYSYVPETNSDGRSWRTAWLKH